MTSTLTELRAKEAERARRLAPQWLATFVAIRTMQAACAKRIYEIISASTPKAGE